MKSEDRSRRSDMLQFVTTADGSKTIYNSVVDENYHSRHGSLQESRHVFLRSGLEYFLANNLVQEVAVLEVGFGTGLNFLLSADHCISHAIQLDYTGIEAHPLSAEMISQTEYDRYVSPATWKSFIEQYPNSLKGIVQMDQYCG